MNFVDAFGEDLRLNAHRSIRRRRIRRRAVAGGAAAFTLLVLGAVSLSQLSDRSVEVDTVDRPDVLGPVDPDPQPDPTVAPPLDDDTIGSTVPNSAPGQDPPTDGSTGQTTTPAETSTLGSADESTISTSVGSSTATTTEQNPESDPDPNPDPVTETTASSPGTCPSTVPSDATRYAGQALVDTGWLRATGIDQQPSNVTLRSGRIGIDGGIDQFLIDFDPDSGTQGESEQLTIEFDQPICLLRFSVRDQQFNRVSAGVGDVGIWVSLDAEGKLSGSDQIAQSMVAPGSSVADGELKIYDTGLTTPTSQIWINAKALGNANGDAVGSAGDGDGSSFSIEWIEVVEPE